MDNKSCLNNNRGFINLVSDRLTKIVSKGPIAEDFDVDERPFARGKFATVRRCRDKLTNKVYAAKFIRKRRRAMDVRHEIIHEIAVLKLCRLCKYIVNLNQVYETSSEMILILELAEGGEIQRLIDEDEILKEEDVIKVMRQILEGLSFMHDKNIAHLDLKPQNILLTRAFPHYDIKLCDFGISRLMTKGVEIREIMGTPDYVAPEVLNYEPISLATDMWSVGVLTYVLLTGHSPFAGDTKQETYCNISHVQLDFPEELFQDISTQATDFISKLLKKDPSTRLTARECFNHPWLRQDAADNSSSVPVLKSPLSSPPVLKSPLSSPRMPYRSLQHSRENCDKENINVVDHLDLNSRLNSFNSYEVVC